MGKLVRFSKDILKKLYLVTFFLYNVFKQGNNYLQIKTLIDFGNTFYFNNEKKDKENSLIEKKAFLIMEINPKKAIELLNQGILQKFRTANYHFAISACFYLLGEYKNYVDHYKQAVGSLESEPRVESIIASDSRFISKNWGIGHIGHLGQLGYLAQAKILNLLSSEKRIILDSHQSNSNKSYLKYFKKYFDVIELSKLELDLVNSKLTYNQEHLALPKLKFGFIPSYDAMSLIQSEWENMQSCAGLSSNIGLLELTEDHKEFGYSVLRKMGVQSNSWFVSLHVRETTPGYDKDSPFRTGPNADIASYYQAIESITKRGGWVIRLGHKGMTRISKLDKVIDYANSEFKSPKMDIFLMAECKFFIGTASGPMSVPLTFGTPILYSNAPALGLTFKMPNTLFLPKTYRDPSRNTLLGLEQIMSSPIGWSVSSHLPDSKIMMIDNTSEDIKNAVDEIFDLLDGKIALTQNQKNYMLLQENFNIKSQMKISSSFLENNKYLL